jgi:penicillin-binding protein 1B
MAKKKPKKRSVKKKPNIFASWLKKALLIGFVGFLFLFLTYLGYLDYTVRKQFEGRRWAIPARVYASPVELYAGYQISQAKFENLLQQLHYRRDRRLTSAGTYYKQGGQLNIRIRSFTFWDQRQPEMRVKLSFSSGSLTTIVGDQGTNIAIMRMDPVQIGSFYPTLKEDRVLIKLENTPEALIQGLLSTEDRDFYQHYGISLRAIARAMWANIRAGGIVQGGSTITQQLIKNFYLTSTRSFLRKANEAFMALIMEARYSKDEILEAYLNEVYLGQDGASAIHGFGLAAEFYFGSPLQNLDLDQIAVLVALVRGPSYYDPRRYPERVLKRRNLVLTEMQRAGYIGKEQANEAKLRDIGVIPFKHRSVNRYPGFLDLVRRQLSQEYRNEDLTSEGLRIFTTLDTQIQNVLEQSIKATLQHLEKRPKVNKLETAAIVTRRDSGEIVALASGRNRLGVGFNRALDAVRPIGSLIKPVVYLTALEYPDRYTIITPISDAAIQVKRKNGKTWAPKNYDRVEHGEVPLHRALANSYNLATVRLGMDIGIARTAKTLKNLGVNRPVDLYPSLLLGATPLTPMEVTQMYQTLAGDGFATPLRAIQAVISSTGEPLQRYPLTIRQTVDPAATYITNTILQEVMSSGTGRSAYKFIPEYYKLAGKTGTTNGFKDSWFAGFSGDFLSVIWVGRDDNKSAGLTGASGALRVWTSLMKQVSQQPVMLIAPDNIEMVWIDPETGLKANEQCTGAKQYPFVVGSAPEEDSPCVQTPLNRTKNWFNRFLQGDL